MMHPLKLILAFLLLGQAALAQLTLESCQAKARQNYPLIRQLDLLEKSANYQLSNAEKAFLPQVNVVLKASYQSDAIDVTLPIPPPAGPISLHQSKDQYQATVEVNQLLWDGGTTNVRKKLIQSNTEVEKQKLEVELYALRDRINQLFFGTLLLTEQQKQLELMQNELQVNLQKLQAAQKNGVLSSSDVDAFKVEILTVKQRSIELKSADKAYRTMLSALIGEAIEETLLVTPTSTLKTAVNLQNRPEMQLFEKQKQALDQQITLDETTLMPKLGLFLQGGYGRPGLNMLSDEFSPFYIGGARITWSLGSLYTHKNNLSSMDNSKKMLESARETFVLNTNLKKSQQELELEKLNALIRTDDEVLSLRTSIKEAYKTKLANGIATTTDLLREMNAESNARQQKTVHELQRLLQIETINYTNNTTTKNL